MGVNSLLPSGCCSRQLLQCHVTDSDSIVQVSADSSVAAAQLLPTESATGDGVSIYQLKWVEWKEDFSPIVVQVGSLWVGGVGG